MIDFDTLAFALAAGLVAALNPCGFAMLSSPTLVVLREDSTTSRLRALTRAALATVVMAAGFLVVFGAFGLVVAPLATSVQRYLPFVTILIGLVLLTDGALLLFGREITLVLPKTGRGAPTARPGTMFGYGLASLSCTIGPFLTVTSTTIRGGSVLNGVLAFLFYGMGMALLVGTLAVSPALVGASAPGSIRRLLPHVGRISGVLPCCSPLVRTARPRPHRPPPHRRQPRRPNRTPPLPRPPALRPRVRRRRMRVLARPDSDAGGNRLCLSRRGDIDPADVLCLSMEDPAKRGTSGPDRAKMGLLLHL